MGEDMPHLSGRSLGGLGFFLSLLSVKMIRSPGVPIVAQWKQIQLVSKRMWVWPLALLSGLRIRCCLEPWCRSQTLIRYGIAVAVVQACIYSSDSTPSLRTSICRTCSPKKKKKIVSPIGLFPSFLVQPYPQHMDVPRPVPGIELTPQQSQAGSLTVYDTREPLQLAFNCLGRRGLYILQCWRHILHIQ